MLEPEVLSEQRLIRVNPSRHFYGNVSNVKPHTFEASDWPDHNFNNLH